MDLDNKVESAGVHSHDRITDTTRSAAGGGGGNDGWGCRLLRRGCDLARKAAIAGAAATAAPVVGPPLIVLSAAGVALSVPFAAYLASLAATNHLTGALLRSCQSTSQPCYQYQEEDDDWDQEFLDASEEYGQGALAFGHLGTGAEQGILEEGDEGDTALLLPRDHGVSEVVPGFADEVGGEFSSVQESGLESYTSDRGDETEQHTPVEGRKMLPMGFGVSASAKPLFSDEDSQVQKKREDVFSVLDSGRQSFESENWSEKEGDVYSKYKEEDGRTTGENKSAKETQTLPQGLYFPELRGSASGDKDSGVQEKGGEFSAQNLDQYTLLSNTSDKQEQDMTMEEKKSTEDMPPPDFVVSESSVPVFRGEGNVAQSKEGFEVAVQGVVEEASSNTDLDMGEVDDVQVEIIAIAAPESEVLPPGNHVSRESPADVEVVDAYAGIAAAAVEPESEVRHPSNVTTSESPADPVTIEIVDVQVDIVAAAAPESEVLPVSSLAALLSHAVAETAHHSEVKNEKAMAMEEKKSTEDMPPSDSAVSRSSVPVLGGEDDVAQTKERLEVAVQEVVEEANSNTDLVISEVADVQVEIIAIAAPESEVLPPSNLVSRDSPADPIAGEIVHAQVDIVPAVAPGSEVLHPSDLGTSESPADPATAEIVDVCVDIVAAAAPGSEVLPLSSLAACKSREVAETAHIGEIIGITVMEDIVRGFDDVNREGVNFVPVASLHDDEDVMSSGRTPYLSTVEEEVIDQPSQSTDVGYTVNEGFRSRVVAGSEGHYTEEQLREQLDTIRTITGYRDVPSPTLEGELAGLYIFVGVEPAVDSVNTSDRLMELNAKLQFLKSIIGVD